MSEKNACIYFFLSVDNLQLRGYSSVGRATGSQSVGREFDSPYLHQFREVEGV